MRVLASLGLLLLLSAFAPAQRPATKRAAPRPPAKTAEAQKATTEAEDRQAIEDLHQDDVTGSLAFDIDKLTNILDDDVVSLPPNSKPIVGKSANHEFLLAEQKRMANVEILGYEQTWDEVRILGEYAYEYGTIRSRIRAINAKDETPLEYNVMRILKKQPSGAWKVYRTIRNDRRAAPEQKK